MKNTKEKNTSLIHTDTERRILACLMLKSSFLTDIGLFSGKMGIVLFFVHYNKYTSDKLYEDIADELMEEIWEEVTKEMPADFQSGLYGIGWGLEYLIQKGFVEGDSLSVCYELDKRIIEKDPRRMTDFSLDKGLAGLLHYVLAHIKGCMLQDSRLPFDAVYLQDVFTAVSSVPETIMKKDPELSALAESYKEFFTAGSVPDYDLSLRRFIKGIHPDDTNLADAPLGIRNGLAGYMFEKYDLLPQ